MEYITIKGVNAEPMTGVDAEKKGYRTNGNTGDGFEVTYVDGYKSWCPKDVFLRDAHEVKKDVLKAWSKGTLKFTPTCPKKWYEKKQLPAMKAYRDVLNKRGVKEGIFEGHGA